MPQKSLSGGRPVLVVVCTATGNNSTYITNMVEYLAAEVIEEYSLSTSSGEWRAIRRIQAEAGIYTASTRMVWYLTHVAKLAQMPPIEISRAELARFGRRWTELGERLSRTPPQSSGDFGKVFDSAVGSALAQMLGDIPIETPSSSALTSNLPDCVEVGPVRVIGGVRPQNFDVGYRPDGIRFAFDSKTLNDTSSVRKNWQNMINDLATEATTVHGRFPYAVVAFLVALPAPSIAEPQQSAIIGTLERLARRVGVDFPVYMAEAISLVVWDPADGMINPDIPEPSSALRIEAFSEQVERSYIERYKGLPPHD